MKGIDEGNERNCFAVAVHLDAIYAELMVADLMNKNFNPF